MNLPPPDEPLQPPTPPLPQPPAPQQPMPQGPWPQPPPYVQPKSPGLAVLASFFIPGLGSMISGNGGIGALILTFI